jgi:hypothetical protein
MILYTSMPQEMIYPPSNEAFTNQSIISYRGVPVVVDKSEEGQYKIIRLLSTDPNDYLNGDYSPGTMIELTF